EIPYRPIIEVSQYEMQAKILQSVLTTKKTKQATRLSRVLQENDPFQRYMLFNEELPELRNVLTQVEQAQLLSISRALYSVLNISSSRAEPLDFSTSRRC